MSKYFKLLRVKHYIKNLLIFIPAFFGGAIFDLNLLISLTAAFFCFSFAASFIYIINDLKDCELDRQHKVKRNRPIAAGEIAKTKALIIAVLLILVAIIGILWVGQWKISQAFAYLLAYVILNFMYSFFAKKLAIVDVLILASGFVIRILYGAAACHIWCSEWLILTIMSISLYLGLGKRRNELINIQNGTTRHVLEKYTEKYLDGIMKMSMTISIVFYSLWSMEVAGEALTNYYIWTIPLVIAIFMKYELIIENGTFGDPVEVIYENKSLIVLALIYVAVMVICKYLIYR